MTRFALATAVAAVSAIASASSAVASVTVGQLAPSPALTTCNGGPFDAIQPTVTAGNPYVVPATGGVTSWTATSWSHNASADPGQSLTMKFYRQVAGLTYTVVGHDGPRSPTAGTLNTFSGLNIPVKSGDVLGISPSGLGGNNGCSFVAVGDQYRYRVGSLADGQSDVFGSSEANDRLNITAIVTPTNTFELGDVDRNKKKGTAKLTVIIPNPGELVLSGKGLRRREKSPDASGDVVLKIKAKKSKLDRLEEVGKVKVKPKITFTPSGGDPNAQSRKLKLKKNV